MSRRGGYRNGSFNRNRGRNHKQGNRIKYMKVDPNMLVKKADPKEAKDYDVKNPFESLPIAKNIKANISHKGYSSPTPIQDEIIPKVVEGRDVIGLASTGTGKTAAFLIPLIDKVQKDMSEKVLIIVPTRELAVQIQQEGKELSRGMNTYFSLVIGGANMRRQMGELNRNPSFVVGTPGRLKDLTQRGVLRLQNFNTIVLDEVDRMLDMGFINDIRDLISKLSKPRHSLFFSATMSDKARQVANEFLSNPHIVKISPQSASENVDQDVVRVGGRKKTDVLHSLLIDPEYEKVLVFGRTKRGLDRLARELSNRGFKAELIHGDKSQNQRQRALNAFKSNKVSILLATDVASRGIDIDNVSHVINYELPETYEDYIHRIGRTGRVDKTGSAVTFID